MIVFKIRLNIFISVTSYDFSRLSLIDIIPDKTVICNCHNKQDRIMLAFLIESANLKRFLNYETIPSYQKAYYLCVVCFINTYLEMGLLFFLSAIKYITLYRKIRLSSNARRKVRNTAAPGLVRGCTSAPVHTRYFGGHTSALKCGFSFFIDEKRHPA